MRKANLGRRKTKKVYITELFIAAKAGAQFEGTLLWNCVESSSEVSLWTTGDDFYFCTLLWFVCTSRDSSSPRDIKTPPQTGRWGHSLRILFCFVLVLRLHLK